jgi:hypothetical protein
MMLLSAFKFLSLRTDFISTHGQIWQVLKLIKVIMDRFLKVAHFQVR